MIEMASKAPAFDMMQQLAEILVVEQGIPKTKDEIQLAAICAVIELQRRLFCGETCKALEALPRPLTSKEAR